MINIICWIKGHKFYKTKRKMTFCIRCGIAKLKKIKPNYNKEILKLLEQLWNKYPNLRMGQLLECFVFEKDQMFYQEDEKTIKRLKQSLKKKLV